MAIKATIPSFNENNFIAWVLLFVKRHDRTNRKFIKCFVVTKRLKKKTTYFSRKREETSYHCLQPVNNIYRMAIEIKQNLTLII